MNTHEIEPVLLLGTWLIELDLSIPESSKQAFIPYITHAI